MTYGQDISADVSFTGNTVGVLPSSLLRPDTFDFAISEGEKDFGVLFKFEKDKNHYIIKKDQLNLNIGEKYKFRGIGTNKGLAEPTIILPQSQKIDTIIVKDSRNYISDRKQVTQVECLIKVGKSSINESYFHIIPSNENKNIFQVRSFLKDHSAFKRLKNKPGFLVDNSRLSDGEIHLLLEVTDDKPSTILDFNLYNTTKSYYDFNFYMSNNTGTTSYESPAIAGFNIKSDKAFGSFSARTLTQERVNLK